MAHLSYTHYYFVFKYLFQHHGYLHALDFQPCLIWSVSWGILSWGILSWGYFWSSMSPTSLEGGSEVVREYFQLFPNKIYCLFLPTSSRIYDLLLSLGLQPYNRSSGGASFDLLIVPKVPNFFGFNGVPRNTALWLQATSWEVWSLPYFILVLRRRRFWWADLLLSNGVFSIDIFPCVLWDVEDKV